MDEAKLDSFLRQTTDSETWHVQHPGEPSPVYQTTPTVNVEGQEVMLFDWKNTLLERSIALVKETRFTTIPPHVNHDMELSYVYDGTCDFLVNRKRISLSHGDVIIFDTDVIRSSPSYKTANDIVISMVFRKEFFDSMFLSRLPGGGILTNFLFEYISRRRRHDKFLLVPAKYAGNMDDLMRLLCEEYFFPDRYSAHLQASYVTSIMLELIRGLTYRGEASGRVPAPGDKIVDILDHIERNYKSCTLASTATKYGYSTNYLGNLLKNKTGRTFSQIKASQQMSEAAYLLLNTSLTIGETAEKVGICNMSYFYRQFRNYFKMGPKEYQRTTRT